MKLEGRLCLQSSSGIRPTGTPDVPDNCGMPNGDFESIYQESLSLLDSILQDISLHISVLLCKIVKRLKLYSFVHQSKSFSISVLAILRYPAGNPKDKDFAYQCKDQFLSSSFRMLRPMKHHRRLLQTRTQNFLHGHRWSQESPNATLVSHRSYL